MKKTVNKPEDWQGFERLCKKLFGEIWGCPHTIKMNGRRGQAQTGVDVYCIPKDASEYYGIQCKGKDDYTNAQLTKKETLAEIAKARTFEPPLNVFVIATTANKDVHIEKFIRLQNIKSRQENSFEIIYYAWQDLVDLIESNRATYQWYVDDQQFADKHDVLISLNDQEAPFISPQYFFNIRTYKLSPKPDYIDIAFNQLYEQSNRQQTVPRITVGSRSKSPQFNYAWCQIKVVVENTGSAVMEDWKLLLQLEKEKIKEITGDYQGEKSAAVAAALAIANLQFIQTVFIDNNTCRVDYAPHQKPLIQQDKKHFSFWLRPVNHEVTSIDIGWQILARDFSKEGTIKLDVQPQITQQIKEILVDRSNALKPDEQFYQERIGDQTT